MHRVFLESPASVHDGLRRRMAVLDRLRKKLGEWFGSGRSGSGVMLWLLRGCFGAIVIGMAWVAFDHFNKPRVGEPDPTAGIYSFVLILSLGFLVVATDVLVRSKQITTISAVYFGL